MKIGLAQVALQVPFSASRLELEENTWWIFMKHHLNIHSRIKQLVSVKLVIYYLLLKS